jgi:uncharacterized protein
MLGSHTFKVLALGAGILAASFTMAPPASAGFEEGGNAYLKKNYALALAEWRPLAEQGHSASQFGMGLAYENGRGVASDPIQAAIWYRKAAEQGLADAQFNLGNVYLNGRGVDKDLTEAVRWFRRAAEQGMPHAQVNLGYSYETGTGVTTDPERAVRWYRAAAEQNFPRAQFYLGLAYERGLGVQQNPALAAGWYKKAAALGEGQAADRLDLLRSRGIEATDLPPTDGIPPALALEGGGGEPAPQTVENESVQASKPAETPEAAVGNESATLTQKPTANVEADPDPAPKPVAQQPAVKKSAASAKDESTAGTNTPSGSRTAAPGKQVSSLAGSHRVRLASYRDPSNGTLGWKTLTRKYDDTLLGLNWAMAEVDLGDKGIYHRLEAGPLGSREEAIAVCAEIKAGGDSCLAVKP